VPEPTRRSLPTDLVPPPSLRAGVALMWEVAPAVTAVLAIIYVVLGLVPAAAMLASGQVVAAISAAADAGGGLTSPEGRRLLDAILVLSAVFVAGPVLHAVTGAFREGYRMAVYFEVEQRAMAAALAPPLLDHLEHPGSRQLLELATHRNWPNMAAFAGDVMVTISNRVTAVTSAMLVARFDPRVAIGLVVVWSAIGYRRRRRMGTALTAGAVRSRRPQYYRQLALHRGTAAELRVFGLAPWIMGRFEEGWRDAMGEVWRTRRSKRMEMAVVAAVIVLANAIAFALVARAATSGRLDAEELTVVGSAMLALAQLGLPTKQDRGVAEGATVVPALLELERVSAVEVARARSATSAATVDPTGRPRHEIRFEAVVFRYPTRDEPVLDGLDLVIPAGRSLAVVGANGAGKTTLVKLLARLHDPTSGTITVDGLDLASFEPAAWQRQVAAIFQDFTRFELSAADNVGFGGLRRAGIVEALDRAAERAGALDLITGLPRGWDTVVSRRFEAGTELSGGQWQRLALARALMAVEAGADVLVLDEPTANLDVRGEVELFDRFLEVTQGCTTILISHRFSTVRRADRIAVVEAGRVCEQGTHDELVCAGGRYAAMFALQADRYRSGRPGLPVEG